MRKRIYPRIRKELKGWVLAIALLFTVGASAQLVDIPDLDLQAHLDAQCGCVVDGQIDASTWIPPVTTLVIPTSIAQDDVLDLSGLEQLIIPRLDVSSGGQPLDTVIMAGFPMGLELLNLDPMVLADFPDVSSLPATTRSFGCSDCGLTAPLDFQAPLEFINISACDLSTGIINVPPTVTELYLQSDQLSVCPSLPPVLESLNLGENAITSLPLLPSTLTSIWVGDNLITEIPALPSGSLSVHFGYNPVTSLPSLPNGLVELIVDGTLITEQLTSLPDGLGYLSAANLSVDILPAVLPPDLTGLAVSGTPVVSLPELPDGLLYLNVEYCNTLECLPILPNGLENLFIGSTAIDCLPNIPVSLLNIPYIGGVPATVCNPGITPCEMHDPLITGTVFNDADSDGSMDVGDTPRPNAIVRATPGNLLTMSGADGRYVMPASVANYTVNGLTIPYNTITTPAGPVSFTALDQIDSLNHVGYHTVPGMYDLVLSSMANAPVRPGFDSEVWFTVKNIGTEVTSATMSFTLDPVLDWLQATPAETSLNGNQATWTIPVIGIGETVSFTILLHTDAGVLMDTPVQFLASATPAETDQTPLNNFKLVNDVVVSSFDPNDKRVEPTSITEAEVDAGDRVIYTVRFQNTGTFPAERVVVVDTITTDLQRSTFQYIGSSHPCTWYLLRGTAVFIFDPINLPDSGANGAASHGYVQFSIVPQPSLLPGAVVHNEAYIYFDYNQPILTNTADLTIDLNTSQTSTEQAELRLWPAPAGDELFISGLSGPARAEVLDLSGRIIQGFTLAGGAQAVDVSHLPPGTYTLRVHGDDLFVTRRFIKG